MNSITVAGNLTKDAEVRHLNDGTPVASFGIADNQGKDKPAIFWNASLFGKRAESLAQYLTRGQAVTVTGTVTEREWTDKDGAKRKSMDVRVNDVALQGGKRDAAPAQAPAAPRKGAAQSAGFEDDGSDIPFASSAFAHDQTTAKARRMARYDY
jgi:single-strand DNA-binding protein